MRLFELSDWMFLTTKILGTGSHVVLCPQAFPFWLFVCFKSKNQMFSCTNKSSFFASDTTRIVLMSVKNWTCRSKPQTPENTPQTRSFLFVFSNYAQYSHLSSSMGSSRTYVSPYKPIQSPALSAIHTFKIAVMWQAAALSDTWRGRPGTPLCESVR